MKKDSQVRTVELDPSTSAPGLFDGRTGEGPYERALDPDQRSRDPLLRFLRHPRVPWDLADLEELSLCIETLCAGVCEDVEPSAVIRLMAIVDGASSGEEPSFSPRPEIPDPVELIEEVLRSSDGPPR